MSDRPETPARAASGTAPATGAPPTDLSQYRAVLLDLDGTVYHEEHALPGAIELIRRLQRDGTPYACLTNSTDSPHRLTERLRRMGVDVDPGHIYTAAAAACDYVMQRFGDPAAAARLDPVMLDPVPPGSAPPDAGPASAPGLRVPAGGAPPPARKPRVLNVSTEGVQSMLDGKVHWVRSADEPCDAVICGVPINVYATEDRRLAALVQLRRGAALVGICADRVYPSPRGLEFGVGAMAAMYAYAANVTPVFCGKPEPLFFRELCRRLGVLPERCVLVGDNLESDIAGGRGVGMRTLLTLTGVATRADVAKVPPHLRPDGIIDSLADL